MPKFLAGGVRFFSADGGEDQSTLEWQLA